MTRPTALDVYLGSELVGTLLDIGAGEVGFRYRDAYIAHEDALPISLSLPLLAESHPSEAVGRFFWGLLTDNADALERLASEARTSARNLFGLLAYAGRDVAGALAFVPTDEPLHLDDGLDPLTDDELAEIVADIRRLYRNGGTAHVALGRWSLAGAQGKVSLRFENGRWAIPRGAQPTTHILKPAIDGYTDFDLNEAVAQNAASRLGLVAAESGIVRLADETTALVSLRYDRMQDADGQWTRIHQEDLCQALGVHPARKYEGQGGPSIAQIGRLLKSLSPKDANESALRLFDALAFNYAIANTDGHAKNYSLLMPGPRATLAPLYDITSALPYTRPFGKKFDSVRKLHSAFRHGGTNAFTRITADDWRTVALQLDIDPDASIGRVRQILRATPAALENASDALAQRISIERTVPWANLVADYYEQLHPSVTAGL